MTIERRPQLAQRRRRVLYSHQCEDIQLQATGRRAQSLREARRPAKAYGSRVYRRLRARWFGIVPVRRRTMMLVISVLGAMVLLLTAAHAAAIGWAPLAYRTELARPFQLNRPDSFGNWFGTLLFASGSIASLMIYQLRRHRTSDYRGHYRIWRPVIILLAIASIDRSMRLTDWLGHVVDEALGERPAIAGGDWVRLLLVVGGATFGMRIIAEVRRSKLATASLASAGCMLVFPTLARWNMIKLESTFGTTLLAAAPLIGSALLWIGLVSYLRMLYRDVRNLDVGDRIADHLHHIRRRFQEATRRGPRPLRSPEAEKEKSDPRKPLKSLANRGDHEDEEVTKPAKRRWFGSRTAKPTGPAEEQTNEVADEEATKPAKRRWLGSRAATPTAPAEKPANEVADEDETKPAKRRWLGLKAAKPTGPAEEPANEKEAPAKPSAPDKEAEPRPKRRWLPKFSMRLRPRTIDEEPSTDDNNDSGPGRPQSSDTGNAAETVRAHPNRDETDDEEYIDPESIDWSSLSKAERRRLKRQLKRQDRAA